MRRLLLVAVLLVPASRAQAQSDPAAAREQLRVGIELRKADKCEEAIPHLVESHKLDPQSKALINLADCEERVSHLGAAQKHWAEAGERATAERNDGIRNEAAARLAALEKRFPRLTVRLAPTVPTGSAVIRDGIELGAVSLGVPLPVEPGRHTLVVRAHGHADGVTEVTCPEREACAATVSAGPALEDRGAATEKAPGPLPSAPAGAADDARPTDPGGTRRGLALAVGGLGLVGLGVGSAFGLSARSKWNDAQNGHCHGQACDATGFALAGDAQSSGTAGTILFAGGAALLAAGVVLYVTAPRAATSGATAVRVTPALGPSGSGAVLSGAFR